MESAARREAENEQTCVGPPPQPKPVNGEADGVHADDINLLFAEAARCPNRFKHAGTKLLDRLYDYVQEFIVSISCWWQRIAICASCSMWMLFLSCFFGWLNAGHPGKKNPLQSEIQRRPCACGHCCLVTTENNVPLTFENCTRMRWETCAAQGSALRSCAGFWSFGFWSYLLRTRWWRSWHPLSRSLPSTRLTQTSH